MDTEKIATIIESIGFPRAYIGCYEVRTHPDGKGHWIEEGDIAEVIINLPINESECLSRYFEAQSYHPFKIMKIERDDKRMQWIITGDVDIS